MKEDIFTESLGLRPMSEVRDLVEKPETIKAEIMESVTPAEPDAEHMEDLEFARSNIRGIIAEGTLALRAAVDLAKSSESARTFEVVADLIRTMAETNERYVGISEKKKFERTDSRAQKDATVNIATNNTLVLTTSELLQSLKR